MATAAQMHAAVRNAEADAGYGETRCSAAVGNNTKFGKWYGMNCAAWCAMAVSRWYYDAGAPQPASSSKGFAYTPSGAAWYQAKGAWAGPGTNPERGWVVFFYSNSAGRIAHVGLVRGPRGSDGLVPTVEGNTNGAGSADGGGVLLKRRSPSQALSFRIAGYGIPGRFSQAAEEWWQVSIPESELEKIEATAVEALNSSAGQAAIQKAVEAAMTDRGVYPAIARGEMPGTGQDPTSQHYKDSNRGLYDHTSAVSRVIRQGVLPAEAEGKAGDFSPGHYMESLRHLARQVDMIAQKVGAELDRPGSSASSVPEPVPADPPEQAAP
jgi:hypothetical protein